MGGCTAIDGCPGDRQTTNPVRRAQVLHHRALLLLALLVQQLEVLEAVELREELAAVAAFDGEEEVFGEALLDDGLRLIDDIDSCDLRYGVLRA
jgi:hypothetical protein